MIILTSSWSVWYSLVVDVATSSIIMIITIYYIRIRIHLNRESLVLVKRCFEICLIYVKFNEMRTGPVNFQMEEQSMTKRYLTSLANIRQ
jgi:hypothetical protein